MNKQKSAEPIVTVQGEGVNIRIKPVHPFRNVKKAQPLERETLDIVEQSWRNQ